MLGKLYGLEPRKIEQTGIIPFDEEILDISNSFFLANSTFVAPWKGKYKFTKKNFKFSDEDSYLSTMHGYNEKKSDLFEIKDGGIIKEFLKGDLGMLSNNNMLIVTFLGHKHFLTQISLD